MKTIEVEYLKRSIDKVAITIGLDGDGNERSSIRVVLPFRQAQELGARILSESRFRIDNPRDLIEALSELVSCWGRCPHCGGVWTRDARDRRLLFCDRPEPCQQCQAIADLAAFVGTLRGH